MYLIQSLIEQRKESIQSLIRFDKEEYGMKNREIEEIQSRFDYTQSKLKRDIVPPHYMRTEAGHPNWNPTAYAEALDWFTGTFDGSFAKRGLLLYGNTASCKTRILYCLAAHFMIERNMTPRIYRPGVLHTYIEASVRHECDAMKDILENCQDCKVLMIDDLGKETMSPRYQAFIFEVIEHRIAFHKPTIITMNHSGADLIKKLEGTRNSDPLLIQPLIRRLREEFQTIHCLSSEERETYR